MALALLILALPRLAGALALAPQAGALQRLERGHDLPTEALDALERALARAVAWESGNGALWAQLGHVRLVQAERRGFASADGRRQLTAAIAALESALRRRPADSVSWVRLAGARLVLVGRSEPGVLSALRLSYLAGPHVLQSMPERLALAFDLWPSLTDELRAYAMRDLRYRWARSWDDQRALIRLVCATGRTGVLAQALRGTPGQADFDKLYDHYLSPRGCRENPA